MTDSDFRSLSSLPVLATLPQADPTVTGTHGEPEPDSEVESMSFQVPSHWQVAEATARPGAAAAYQSFKFRS